MALLFDAVTSPTISARQNVSNIKQLGISITGTSTSFVLQGWGGFSGILVPVMGRKVDDTEINYLTSFTEKDKVIIFDVATFSSFEVRLVSIENGNITVYSGEEG